MSNKKRIPIKEWIAYAFRQAYRWIMGIVLSRGWRQPVLGGGYAEILRAWKLGDVTVGDIIELDGKEYMFAGMNRYGDPGQSLFAEIGLWTPYFGPATPQEKQITTSFDTLSFPSWRKIKHIGLEEWETMCEEAKAVAAV